MFSKVVFLQLPILLENELHHRLLSMFYLLLKNKKSLKTEINWLASDKDLKKDIFLFLQTFPVKSKINKTNIPSLGSKSISFKCKFVLRTCCNLNNSSFLLSQSTNFVMTNCVGLHEKSVPSVAKTFSVSYPCSRAAWRTTFSYNRRVIVIASTDLWSFRTMNSDWAVASSGDLFELPKHFWKIEITWLNCKYMAAEHTAEVTVFTVNKDLSAYLLTVWLCKISNQILPPKFLYIYVLKMMKSHI